MNLESIDTNMTEVLDGMAFAMGCGGLRVIVIVTNEAMVRQGLPVQEAQRPDFYRKHLPEWQEVACDKFHRGDFENRGSRVRIRPRDLSMYGISRAAG